MAEPDDKMTTTEVLERLGEEFPETLSADGFEDAIIGVAEGWYSNNSHHCVVCYDYERCVDILMKQGMDEDEAEEWMSFNTMGAYVGPFTPVFLYRWR